MHIGCPKEIKPQEFRVGMTPNAALEAVNMATRHRSKRRGAGAGFTDEDYSRGATMSAPPPKFCQRRHDRKSQRTPSVERKMLREGQTFVHLPAPRTRP